MNRYDLDMLVYLVLMGAAAAVLGVMVILLAAVRGPAIVVLFVTYPVIEIVAIIGAILGLCAWLWEMYR